MQGRLIWITGYSGSGKTTIARRLCLKLREQGNSVIHLDGDELRSILSGRWGYERHERVDLARTYFRLCSHLAAQTDTVVISAVAMYAETRDWVKCNVPGAMQVYLKVPEDERRRRDEQSSKRVYDSLETDKLYDEPEDADLVIENHGSVTPEIAVSHIFETWRAAAWHDADRGRREHWSEFYRSAHIPNEPSTYARSVVAMLAPGSRIVEVGCGNGRDACYFADAGHEVTAIDLSAEAIDLCSQRYADAGIRFLHGTLSSNLESIEGECNTVYSRFCLHAMTAEEEQQMLAASATILRAGGMLFLECRSINDPLARKGEIISPTERIHGHYRRFIVREQLEQNLLAAGFTLIRSDECRGVARLGDDDPVVIRVSALKNG